MEANKTYDINVFLNIVYGSLKAIVEFVVILLPYIACAFPLSHPPWKTIRTVFGSTVAQIQELTKLFDIHVFCLKTGTPHSV